MHDATYKMASPTQRNTLQVSPFCKAQGPGKVCKFTWASSAVHAQLCLPSEGCPYLTSEAYMQEVDVHRVDLTASATEFSEQCELVCFAPMGDPASDWGNELIAGAVHGSGSPCGCYCSCMSCAGLAYLL